MPDNPLQRYFRRPQVWVRLPTNGIWYKSGEVNTNDRKEVQVFGITALDEIMLNTPDALFNGWALESVLKSCVPEINDVKAMCQPDLDAIFLAIRSATYGGKYEFNRKCDSCGHENHYDMRCDTLLDRMTYVEESDTVVDVNGELRVHIKPYDFAMRTVMIQRQLEERRAISEIEDNVEIVDDLQRADLLARSIEKISRLTFRLVAESITGIEELSSGAKQMVTNKDHIAEWLTSINKNTADTIIDAVRNLNNIGPPKELEARCSNCEHSWMEPLNFDPALFFIRR